MNELEQMLDDLLVAYQTLKDEIRRRDKHLFERWKAGGYLVDSDILSMYPNVEEVVEKLNENSLRCEGCGCDLFGCVFKDVEDLGLFCGECCDEEMGE